MGSSQSQQPQQQHFTANELRALLGKDNQWYRHQQQHPQVAEENLFDDDFVAKQYLNELGSCTHIYKEQDQLLQKRLESYEKGLNLMLSLAVTHSAGFQEKEMRWLKKEMEHLTQSPTNAFASVLDKRLLLLRHYYLALIRFDQRQHYRKRIPAPPAPPTVAGAEQPAAAAATRRVDLTSLLRQRLRQRQAQRASAAAAAAAAPTGEPQETPTTGEAAGQSGVEPPGPSSSSSSSSGAAQSPLPEVQQQQQQQQQQEEEESVSLAEIGSLIGLMLEEEGQQQQQEEEEEEEGQQAAVAEGAVADDDKAERKAEEQLRREEERRKAEEEEASRPKRSDQETFVWSLFQGTLDEPLLERVLASLRELPSGEQLLCVDHHDNDFDWSRPPPEAGEQAEQRDTDAAAAAEDESYSPSTKTLTKEVREFEESLLCHLVGHLFETEQQAMADLLLHSAAARNSAIEDEAEQPSDKQDVAPATTTSLSSHTSEPRHILQKDLLKDVAFSQYQLSRLAVQKQQQHEQEQEAAHEERASAEKEARLGLRNLVLYARTVIGHATRLLDAALDTTARLALLREKEERERLEKEERLEKGELEKPEGMDHVEEDGKASSSATAAAAAADHQNNQLPPATRRPQGGSAGTAAAPVDERVREALVQGIVLRIVRPLATALCLFLDDAPAGGANGRLQQHLASSLLTPLVSLLKSLDAINARADDVSGAEVDYHERENAKLLFKTVDRKKVETPHNYYPNTDEEKVVRIPGATHLIVTFDERCNLEKDRDFLHLYRRPGKQQPIFTPFTGPPNAWPRIPIIVPGDTVCFHFTSDPFNTYWGYRCIVTGLTLESSVVPLWDLERTVSSLVGRCVKHLLVGPALGKAEAALARWLDSDLFAGGLLASAAPADHDADVDVDRLLRVENVSRGKEAERSDAADEAEQEVQAAKEGDEELAWLLAEGMAGQGQGAEGAAGYRQLFAQKNRELPDMFDRFGGEVIDEAMRWFVAAALRHLRLVDVARKQERTEDEEKLLSAVWREAKNLRRWVVQEKQRVANEISERQKEEEEQAQAQASANVVPGSTSSSSTATGAAEPPAQALSGSASAVPEKKQPVDRTTYEYFRDTMVAKLRVLLLHYVKHTPEASPVPVLLCRERRAHARAKALQTIHDLVRSLSLLSAKQDILRIAARAWRSIEGVVAPAGSSSSSSRGSSHYLSNTSGCGQAVREQLRVSFSALYQYLTTLLVAPAPHPTDIVTCGHVLNFWCLNFKPEDHPFLTQTHILDICHGLMTTSGSGENKARRRLRVLGRLAFRYLAIQCLAPGASPADRSAAQQHLLETIVQDLELSISFLHQKRQDLGRVISSGDIGASEEGDITPDTVAYHKEEKFCYAQLVLFHTVTSQETPANDAFLATSRILRLLLFVHFAGTPELQRLALRMLRRILPLVDPALFDRSPELLDFVSGAGDAGDLIPFGVSPFGGDDDQEKGHGDEPPVTGTGEMNALVRHFFGLLGQRLFLDAGEKTGTLRHRLTASHTASFAHNFRDGQVAFMESEEVLMLLRSLVESSASPPTTSWSALITVAARNALLALPALVEAQRFALIPDLYRRPRPVYHTLAALCLLGGCVEGLRVTSTRELGTLVFYDRRSSQAKLILDSSPDKVIDVYPGKIRAHPEFQINPDRLPLTKDLLDALIIFAKVSDKRDEERRRLKEQKEQRERAEREQSEREAREARERQEREEEEERKRQEAAAAATPPEWTCEMCTLINEINEPFCQACGSPRPADAVPSVVPNKAKAAIPSAAAAEQDKAPGAKEEEEEEEDTLAYAEEDILFYQLRSRATKALCKLMTHPANAVLVAEQGGMSTLLSIAVRPTELEEFKSLEQLETRQDRLLELLYQHGVGMEREEVGPQQLSQAELLEHNPFKGQPVNLPSAFDRSSARAVGFIGGQMRTLVGRANPMSVLEGVGLARANFAIPNSLPAFYFEIRFVKDESFKGSIEAQLIADESDDDDNDNDAEIAQAATEGETVATKDSAVASPASDVPAPATEPALPPSGSLEQPAPQERQPQQPESEKGKERDERPRGKQQRQEGEEKAPKGLNIGVGLYREGIPLQGAPGEHNSYAYVGSRGRALHNVGNLRVSGIDSRAYGPTFNVGDVVGCGWDIRGKSLYFTLNGQYLGSAFSNVSGRFYPVVWIRTSGVKVQVNFGQEPFLFEFVSTLPEGYLEGMEHMESKAKVMTIQEIKRRTQAEELMMMMGVFPLELCVVALERSRDDITYAANWLLERGYQELDRWAKDTIAVSKREQEEREMKVLLDTQQRGDNQRGSGQSTRSESRGADEDEDEEDEEGLQQPYGGGGDEEADEEEWEDEDGEGGEEEDDDDGGSYSEDYNRDAGRFLDDELGADTPVQVERRERIVEGMKFEDIVPGIQLRVSPNSIEKYAHIMHTLGRIGVVADTDIDTLRVLLRLANPETASRHYFWFYFYDLEKPEGMYQDPCMDLVSSSTKIKPSAKAPTKSAAWLAMMKHHLVEISNALLILQVRRCVLSLISSWTELDLALLGGPRYLIDLLKLASAEHLASKAKNPTSGGWVGELDVLASFRAKLASLLRGEEGLFPSAAQVPPLALPTYNTTKPMPGDGHHTPATAHSGSGSSSSSSSSPVPHEAETSSLTKLVTEECILHFVQAVSIPPPAIMEESAHPYENNQDYRKEFHINGASRLIIRFDPRCHMNTDMLSRVAFYRDDQYQDPIAVYRGKMGGSQFQPLIVNGDTVYFRFTTGPVATFWGFKFTVTPLEWRLNDNQALQGLNFELGYWFLELLLEEGPSFVRNVYLVDLYDALVWYIRAAKRSAKGRGIQLLLRVLREINVSSEASRKVLLQKVLGLRKKMDAIYSKEVTDSRGLLHSAHLQSLVELVAVARLVGDEIHRSSERRVALPALAAAATSGSDVGKQDKGKEKEEEEEKGEGEEAAAGVRGELLVEVGEVGRISLRIKKAVYGRNLDKRRSCRNVTRELQDWVDRVGGGQYLWLPPNHQTALPFLSGAPPRDRAAAAAAAAALSPASSCSPSFYLGTPAAAMRPLTTAASTAAPTAATATSAAAAAAAASSVGGGVSSSTPTPTSTPAHTSPEDSPAHSPGHLAAAAAASGTEPASASASAGASYAGAGALASEGGRSAAATQQMPIPIRVSSSSSSSGDLRQSGGSPTFFSATAAASSSPAPLLGSPSTTGGGSFASSLSSSSGAAPIVPSNRRLKIWYEIVDHATGTVLEHAWQRSVGSGEQLVVKAELSWFGTVVSVADQVQSLLKRNGRFSRRLLAEAFRQEKLSGSFHALVGADPVEVGRGAGFSRPGLGSGSGDVGSWSLAFWLYVLHDHTGHMRLLLLRGLDAAQSRQAVMLGSNDRRVVVTMSTENDWRESFASNSEVPLAEWTHVVVRCEARQRSVTIFLNGLPDGEHRLSSPAKPNPHPFYLGQPPEGVVTRPAMDGCEAVVRDMRFYTRALAPDEAGLLHQRAAPAPDLRAQRLAPFAYAVPSPALVSVEEFEAFLERASKGWGLEALTQVVELVVGLCDETKQDPLVIDADTIAVAEEDLNRFPAIRNQNLSLADIRVRFTAVRLFNRQLTVVLPLVDFSQTHLSWSLAHSVCKLTGLIFPSTKVNLWNKILNSTMSRANKPSVTINRPRALRAKEKGDPEGSRSVFGQAYRQLHFLKPEVLRVPGQTFSVTYEGEGGRDAGGLFRDCISHMCADLHSSWVPLFIPCPNAKGFGENQDKWIPNPLSLTSLHLSMYAFVGKLMGIAIRGKHILNLDLPSIVWKQLVGAELTVRDLELIDKHCVNQLEEVRAMTEGTEEERVMFEALDYTWATPAADGKTLLDLCPNGRDLPVRFEDRLDYARKVEAARLNEFREQVENMRKGMATIIPIQLLSLFTWQELELNVCGKNKIDIQLLRENTRYQSGFSDEDEHVQMMWRVLESFTHKQRELFLRFVWGRSRLPLTSLDFQQKFVILSCAQNNDMVLPISHTCFFQLELPRYSADTVLREKLLYAITYCRDIDTDFRAAPVDWDADE